MPENDHPISAAESARTSLVRQDPKQTLLKEVVKVRGGVDGNTQWADVAKKVAAGKSLFLTELNRRQEKARG